MRIVDGGLLTTVQDLGRPGYQRDGVTPGGAMDALALRVANVLVHNDQRAAGLEITVRGPTVEFTSDALVCICGAELSPSIADMPVPNDRAIAVRAGATLDFSALVSGCRAYLAVGGGIDVPLVMGSRSTYLRAALGGYEGRALRAGDELSIGAASERARVALHEMPDSPVPFALSPMQPDMTTYPVLDTRWVRFVRGPHFGRMSEDSQRALVEDAFEVSPQSDRMGCRLTGPALQIDAKEELLSSGVVAGTIQLPPDGAPIVLMADRQTTGGYPVIGHVITADLPRVAQKRPGEDIRFEEVTIPEAQSILRAQERWIAELDEEVDARAPDRSQF